MERMVGQNLHIVFPIYLVKLYKVSLTNPEHSVIENGRGNLYWSKHAFHVHDYPVSSIWTARNHKVKRD